MLNIIILHVKYKFYILQVKYKKKQLSLYSDDNGSHWNGD